MPYNHRRVEELYLTVQQKQMDLSRVTDEFASKEHDLCFRLRDGLHSLKDLRVAAIMDAFTLNCFLPECTLLELLPDQFTEQMDAFHPDLVFIESAWSGKDNSWFRKIDRGSREISTLAGYCRARKIPIVFWNKEDPVSTSPFFATAKLCDYIFTTDADCLIQYKHVVGHNRVYHLHFAAQPKLHNPIETYERIGKICFAGAYYPRYPDRLRVMEDFTAVFEQRDGIDIYDRNYGDPNSPHAFPARYAPYILGKLEPTEIDRAYKGYRYGMNLNSISQSQTMFARRVFELLASNTVVVGNYARGVKNYFGELTICTDSAQTLTDQLDTYCSDETTYRKYRLLGLRKVLKEHLYEDRLDRIVQTVFGQSLKAGLPAIRVCAHCETSQEKARVQAMFDRQTYPNKALEWVDSYATAGKGDEYLCFFSPEDDYGGNYLCDLALATRYSDCGGYTKPAQPAQAYRFATAAPLRRSIVRSDLCAGMELTPDTCVQGAFLAIDEFNYRAHCPLDQCGEADDFVLRDQGIDLRTLEQVRIEETEMPYEVEHIEAPELYERISLSENSPFSCSMSDGRLRIDSTLSAAHSQYIYMSTRYSASKYSNLGRLTVKMHAADSTHLFGICWFHDKQGLRMNAHFIPTNELQQIAIPAGADYFKFGFLLQGEETQWIDRFDILSRDGVLFSEYYTAAKALTLTNIYPSPDDLYRNMFVHRRVCTYKQAGLDMDVMRFGIGKFKIFREFEGVNVIEGRGETLCRMLKNDSLETICVHFLRQDMWDTLKPYLNRLRLIIWCHGAEIQPWWRRTYNYSTEKALEAAKKESDKRQELWWDVFQHIEQYNIHFVFVSQYFADEVCEDYKVDLPKSCYTIIHNLVDTNLFTYEKKDADQRKKMLSIRPYASNKYANDLTVKCICALASKPFFNELSFRIIGNGPMFDEINEPLRQFDNVELEQRFLTQGEIAQYHKEYGIFLTPTRMDAQGVSRDEAMSSGLVPVTNAVAAIPEFTDDSCAILAPGEDYLQMAEGIERLYHDPALFLRMSENAARRVRGQTDAAHTTEKEIELIKRKANWNK